MKIKFKGVPGEEHRSIPSYGYTFPLDKWVDVTNPEAIRKLKSHPHFEAKDDVTDVPHREVHDYQRDGASQLANATGDHDVATAQLQGKEPAPNAKAGLVPDIADANKAPGGAPLAEQWSTHQKASTPTATPSSPEQMKASVKAKLAAKPNRADLEALAVAVGVKADGRWSDERLREEIEKAA